MKESEIREEVYKCSKCALCQSVCPVFIALKNEIYLPRGRYNVLNAFFCSGKKFSKKFIKNLDICLNCGACKDFCPSSIDSVKIYTELKKRYRSFLVPFSVKFKIILMFHSIKRLFVKNKLYEVIAEKNKKCPKQKHADVVYFQGCFNKYVNPSDKNAVLCLLEQKGFNVIKVLNGCCGLPFLSDGRLSAFDKNAKKILKSIPENVKYIVVSCDSCYQTLSTALEGSSEQQKLIRFSDLVPLTCSTQKAVFHKPFSLKQYDGLLPVINKKGSCSLAENYLMFKHPDIAKKMLHSVFYNKEDIEGKIVVTSCNLSKWGLIEGCRQKSINAKIMTVAEHEMATGTTTD